MSVDVSPLRPVPGLSLWEADTPVTCCLRTGWHCCCTSYRLLCTRRHGTLSVSSWTFGPDLVSSQFQLHCGSYGTLPHFLLLTARHPGHPAVQTLEREHHDFRTRVAGDAPTKFYSRHPRRAACGYVLVRCYQRGLLSTFQRHSVGGGQFEVLRRGGDSTTKEGSRKEDEIYYEPDEHHPTSRRAWATDVGCREAV
jgi:hypothetical protein